MAQYTRAALISDKAQIVYERFHARAREGIKSLIDDDLIAEHRDKPLGQHSAKLERVLTYLRRSPVRGKHVIVCTKPDEEWRIGRITGRREQPVELVEGPAFGSPEEAEHAIFLERVKELMGSGR